MRRAADSRSLDDFLNRVGLLAAQRGGRGRARICPPCLDWRRWLGRRHETHRPVYRLRYCASGGRDHARFPGSALPELFRR